MIDNEIRKKLKKAELEILDEIDRICKQNDIEYFLVAGTLLGAVRHGGFIPWDDDIDLGMTQSNFKKFIDISKKKLNDKYILDCYENNKKCLNSFIKIRMKNTCFLESKNVGNNFDENFNGIWVDIFCFSNVDEYNEDLLSNKSKKISRLYTLINIKQKTNYYKQLYIKKFIYSIILMFVPFTSLVNKLREMLYENKDDNSKYLFNYMGTICKCYFRDKIFPLSEVSFEGKKYPCPKDIDYYLKKLYNDYMKLPPVSKRETHMPYYIKFIDGTEYKLNNGDNI